MLFALLCLGACLQAVDARPSVAPPTAPASRLGAAETALCAGVDEERAVRRVRELVALGSRMGGTPSGEAAAAYLAEALRELDLAVEVLEDPPAWCHAEERWRVELAATAADGPPVVLESAWPLGFSPAARGEAPLALAGAPGVALITAHAPRWLLRGSPAPGGAPAVVLLDGRTTSDGEHVPLLDLPRDAPCPAFALNRADGALLRALLDAGRPAKVRFELSTRVARARPKTVVARLPGRAPGGFFLVCAHGDSDSGGPGANDNASGEAIVLEMATAWSLAIARGSADPPAREVRFAVWGTEIHSSRAFLERVRSADEDLLGVLNFDQSGFGQVGDRLHVEPDDLAANEPFVRTVLAVLEDARGSTGFPDRWVTNRSLGGTDSYVFSDAPELRAGARPAVTLFASAWDRARQVPRTAGMPGESWSPGEVVRVDHDPFYHSSGDTPENTTDCQPWHMGWGARVGLLAVKRHLEGLE